MLNVNGGIFMNSKKIMHLVVKSNFACCMSISEDNVFPYNLMVFAFLRSNCLYEHHDITNNFPACYIHFSLRQSFSSSPETLQKISYYLLDH